MRARLAALLLSGSLAACLGSTPIGEIVAHPRDYTGREVTVEGTVTQAFSLVFLKTFTLDDGTGRITVITQRPQPRVGERIRVSGRVEEAFSLGSETLTVIVENEPPKTP